jgi:transposase
MKFKSKNQSQTNEQEALKRAELILKVRSGQISAAAAAQQLGVSRKTYYKWEKRALQGMLGALCERNSGRPASVPDEEKQTLKKRLAQREKELILMKESAELHKLLGTATTAEKKG